MKTKNIELKGGKKEMRTEQRNVMKTIYIEKCDICGKEIVGTSESQVLFNLDTHKRSQHPEIKNAKE